MWIGSEDFLAKWAPKDAQRAYNFCLLAVWDFYFVYDLLEIVTNLWILCSESANYNDINQVSILSVALLENNGWDSSVKQVLKAKTGWSVLVD